MSYVYWVAIITGLVSNTTLTGFLVLLFVNVSKSVCLDDYQLKKKRINAENGSKIFVTFFFLLRNLKKKSMKSQTFLPVSSKKGVERNIHNFRRYFMFSSCLIILF